jgi:hypothetical protein
LSPLDSPRSHCSGIISVHHNERQGGRNYIYIYIYNTSIKYIIAVGNGDWSKKNRVTYLRSSHKRPTFARNPRRIRKWFFSSPTLVCCAPLRRKKSEELTHITTYCVRARRRVASVLQRRKRARTFDQRRLYSWTEPGYVVWMLRSAFKAKNVAESRQMTDLPLHDHRLKNELDVRRTTNAGAYRLCRCWKTYWALIDDECTINLSNFPSSPPMPLAASTSNLLFLHTRKEVGYL